MHCLNSLPSFSHLYLLFHSLPLSFSSLFTHNSIYPPLLSSLFLHPSKYIASTAFLYLFIHFYLLFPSLPLSWLLTRLYILLPLYPFLSLFLNALSKITLSKSTVSLYFLTFIYFPLFSSLIFVLNYSHIFFSSSSLFPFLSPFLNARSLFIFTLSSAFTFPPSFLSLP